MSSRPSSRLSVIVAPLLAALALAAFAVALSPGSSVAAAPARDAAALRGLWATINICDTRAHPNTVGIRASMPGTGKRAERMYVRFRLQYYSAARDEWRFVGPRGDSGWVSLGSARYHRRETGRNFRLAAPAEGRSYRIRALVSFEWRRGKRVVRVEPRRTRERGAAVTGADPRGFSAAECTIEAP